MSYLQAHYQPRHWHQSRKQGGETPTGIQPNHPRLEILQQTPNPVNIRGKCITRQTHTSIISLAHGFLLRPELVQRSNRRKALLPRD